MSKEWGAPVLSALCQTYPCLHAYNSLREYPSRGQTLLYRVSCDFCFDADRMSALCHSPPQRQSQRLPYIDPSPAAEIPLFTPHTVNPSRTLLWHYLPPPTLPPGQVELWESSVQRQKFSGWKQWAEISQSCHMGRWEAHQKTYETYGCWCSTLSY